MLLLIKQGEVKLIFETDDALPKSDFLQVARFWTKNPINRPAVNSKIFLVVAVFHFVHPVEKGS